MADEAAVIDLLRLKQQMLEAQLIALEQRVAAIPEDMNVAIGEGPAPKFRYPLQVFVKPGATSVVCVRAGTHLWWNQITEALQTTALSEDGSNAWTVTASTIYVKRIANADGSATVTLERTTSDAATVLAGQTNTEMRWILATIATGGGIQPWWTGGNINEYRVA